MSRRFTSFRSMALCLLSMSALIPIAACHSTYVEATVRNASGAPISPFEVDYPSASFGRPSLAAGAEYKYRFKVLGSGAAKVVWTDAHHGDHSVTGPEFKEGDEGKLAITIGAADAQWSFVRGPLAKAD